MALVWGRNRVPNPAAGITALRTFMFRNFTFLGSKNQGKDQNNAQNGDH